MSSALSLWVLSVLCAFCGEWFSAQIHHRDTKNTEVAQRFEIIPKGSQPKTFEVSGHLFRVFRCDFSSCDLVDRSSRLQYEKRSTKAHERSGRNTKKNRGR